MKKKSNLFVKIIFLFFLMFIVLYIITNNGYYEAKMHNKVILTDNKIKQFEQDVKEGKTISLEDYYIEDKPNYSSAFSKLGKNISNKLSCSMVDFFTQFGILVKKLFW